MNTQQYDNQVYAGVLGKLIGVFYGRPIEGWPYERIREQLGDIRHYVYKEAGTPLIVADDDLSGTFTFFNSVEDCPDFSKLSPADFGETWLNYIIEHKTVFWWGGLGRSTEHTAYERLRSGLHAPDSGSIATNGQSVAEQIGAQIFIDAFALACPNDPERARSLIRQAAQVSHDGIAVESACLIGGMEALAFGERDLPKLLDAALRFPHSERLDRIVDDVRAECAKTKDWRVVRDWLDEYYGYRLYPGNCHVVPNLALILASLLLGGDSFQKAMEIVVSSGWDTDCNGANVGCLNGIRLGLAEIDREFAFRRPIADRFYNISADGGNSVTDAVIQTRRIVREHHRLYGTTPQAPAKQPRFGFELEGSLQGFGACPFLGGNPVVNGNTQGQEDGILVTAYKGSGSAASTLTMWDPADRHGGYCLLASPTLYSGQTVDAKVSTLSGSATARLYVLYYDFNDQLHTAYGPVFDPAAQSTVRWLIPDLKGMTIARVGIVCDAQTEEARVLLHSLTWDGAPERFAITGSLRNYDLSEPNMQMNSFVSSAKEFSFDSTRTFTVSHTEENGVATTGAADWKDYTVTSRLTPGLHDRFGLVARAKGHRKFYAAVLRDGSKLQLLRKNGPEEIILAETEYNYTLDEPFTLSLTCCGKELSVAAEGKELLHAQDDSFTCGGAGFLIDRGTCLADGFLIEGR